MGKKPAFHPQAGRVPDESETGESIMEKKNLRTTDGLPLYLGIAGAILILIASILQSGPSQAYAASETARLGVSLNPMTTYISSIVGFVIYPGIFLILLLVGVGKPRRGSAFAVVWIVISGLEILSSLYSLLAASQQVEDLKKISAAMVPGGYYLFALLAFLGNAGILASCIVFLRRLHTPGNLPASEGFDAGNEEDAEAGANSPKDQ